jgi:hypothetical protein
MTERLPLIGRADPLGHVYLAEDHGDGRAVVGRAADSFAIDEGCEFCPRSARAIALSVRTPLPPIWN